MRFLFVVSAALIGSSAAFQGRRVNPVRSVMKHHVHSTDRISRSLPPVGRHQTLTVLRASPTSKNCEGEGQSVPSAAVSLIKAIVGAGVLAMPSGLAVISDSPKIMAPAVGLIAALGSLSAYTFYLLGRLSHANGAKDLTQIWELEVGKKSSWIVSLSIFTFCLGTALCYSIVLGDTLQSLAAGAGLTGILATRYASILSVTLLALYPLSRLQSLAALAPVSMVGVIGVFFTCIFMAARYFGPAYRLPSGAFLATLAPHLVPSFRARTSQTNPLSALILGSMSATAFMSHFAAPDFLNLLKQGPSTLKDYKRLTVLGFSICALINISILSFGFLTFGGNCAGMVINNYSQLDVGASVCRFLTAVSVTGGYPFLLRACNSSLVRLLWSDREVSVSTSRRISAGLLAGLTALSLVIQNAGVVVSLNGAVMGSAIAYIFPGILLLSSKQGGRLERLSSRLLIAFGVVVALMGGGVSLMNAFAPHLLQ